MEHFIDIRPIVLFLMSLCVVGAARLGAKLDFEDRYGNDKCFIFGLLSFLTFVMSGIIMYTSNN
jgi:hypothetical protein